MNKRILQLAKQAGLKFPSEEALSPVEIKFAELIVRETMQVVANQLPSNQYLDVADAVIKHFRN